MSITMYMILGCFAVAGTITIVILVQRRKIKNQKIEIDALKSTVAGLKETIDKNKKNNQKITRTENEIEKITNTKTKPTPPKAAAPGDVDSRLSTANGMHNS